MITMSGDFAAALRALMAQRGISGTALARRVPCDRAYISRLVNGRQQPSAKIAGRIGEVLGADSRLAALAASRPGIADTGSSPDDETDAWELARRTTASDVGSETLERLEQAVDALAVAYPGTPPAELLTRIRRHLGYVSGLLDARKTLTEHRRLLVTGGWLSLLAATSAIDLRHWPAATARLHTAAQLARDTGHAEMAGWCLETQAWQVLTAGDYRQAVRLAQAAQRAAPRGSSAFIQATSQEGRAWARLGERAETHDALNRVHALASALAIPEQPEHHYRYDPAKSEAYTATTLSWLGDPAAEDHARHVLRQLESPADGPPRPRRAASARIDLSLALAAVGKPDEAGGVALRAITSGRLVPSNYWRAGEVIEAVETHGVPEAAELPEAYREFCGSDGDPS